MRNRSLFLIAVLSLFYVPVRAEIIRVQVPGVAGPYPVSPGVYTRTASIQLPRVPTVIHSAWFRIFGTGVPGIADCGDGGHADSWPLEFIAALDDGAGSAWVAYNEPYYLPGEFERTAYFEGLVGDETWDFIMDGVAELTLSGAPALALGVCAPVVLPVGSVDEAYFFINGEFPLGVEATTWGRVKALYR